MASGGGPGGGSGGDSSSPTPEAATLVVSYLPGVGDYLTPQEAIDNMPVQGGYILLREGTYGPFVFSDKPIIIKGCGRESTIIDLGAADGSAASSAFANKYVIRDLSIVGNPANIQSFLSLGAAAEVLVENVGISDVLRDVETTSTPEVTFSDCSLDMPNAANTAWWTNVFGPGGKMVWRNVESNVPMPSGALISGQPDFSVVDSYSGGSPTISTCDVGRLLLQGFEYDHILFTLNQPKSRVANVVGEDVRFIMKAKGLSIVASDFVAVAEAAAMVSQSGMTGDLNLRVADCTYDGGGVQQFLDLDAADDAAISAVSVSNTFFSNGVTSFMRLITVTMSMTGCQSDFSVPYLSGDTITLIGSPTYAFTTSGALTASNLLTVPGKGQPVTKFTAQIRSASIGSDVDMDILLIDRTDGSTLANLGTLTIPEGDLEATLFLTTPTDVTDIKGLNVSITEPGSGTAAEDLVVLGS